MTTHGAPLPTSSLTMARETLVMALMEAEDDIARAARKLGIAPRTLDQQIIAAGLTEPVCLFCYRDKGERERCTCGASCWVAFALPTRPPILDAATLSMRRTILDAMDRVSHDFDRAARDLGVPAHTLAQRIVASGMTDAICQLCCLTRPPSPNRCECGANCWVLVPARSTARLVQTTRPPTISTAARPPPTLPLVAATDARPVPPSGTGSHPVPAAREPGPVPGSGTSVRGRLGRSSGISPRQAAILDAVRFSPTPLSANAIATRVGGRKAAMLEDVRALVSDGLLVSTKGGFTLAP